MFSPSKLKVDFDQSLLSNLVPSIIDAIRQTKPHATKDIEAVSFSARNPIIIDPKGIIPLKANV